MGDSLSGDVTHKLRALSPLLLPQDSTLNGTLYHIHCLTPYTGEVRRTGGFAVAAKRCFARQLENSLIHPQTRRHTDQDGKKKTIRKG